MNKHGVKLIGAILRVPQDSALTILCFWPRFEHSSEDVFHDCKNRGGTPATSKGSERTVSLKQNSYKLEFNKFLHFTDLHSSSAISRKGFENNGQVLAHSAMISTSHRQQKQKCDYIKHTC